MAKELSSYIDHSLLKPTATETEIISLCEEAKVYFFKAVCIPPFYVSLAGSLLKDSDVNVCTVIGFPLGYSKTGAKLKEAELAVRDGADELDMVINQSAVKNEDYGFILNEIGVIKDNFNDKVVKVIVETCNLNLDEKELILNVVVNSGADFIKTSTGFATAGADLDDIVLFKRLAGDRLKIKASGGIRNRETALKFINAGADRIGTSSGIKIVGGGDQDENA
jgi:deoxyribose-phosphate aldolase